MKKVLLFIGIVLFSCKPADKISESTKRAVIDNEELKKLYIQDQGDRSSIKIDWVSVAKRDSLRLVRVYQLIKSNTFHTAVDYYNGAIIFQHGGDSIASGMAVKMMTKALQLDSSTNKWLLAAAIDRDLMYRNKPQVYGTQYSKNGQDTPWFLYQIDSTKITDQQRVEYGVETLAGQRAKVKQMNKKELYEMFEAGVKIDDIVAFVSKEDKNRTVYDISLQAIISFGRDLIGLERKDDALKIFTLGTQLYPAESGSFNALGNCFLKLGKQRDAYAAYKKALLLNPESSTAKEALSALAHK